MDAECKRPICIIKWEGDGKYRDKAIRIPVIMGAGGGNERDPVALGYLYTWPLCRKV